MTTITKTFELQVDLKPSGAIIRLNDEKGCILRICRIPKRLVFQPSGEMKEYIDIPFLTKI